ncbi:hypothetical protein PILCRDRAFT_823155 [Piloderma croceum F 1598]|uniref:Peptide hydrolase n=1 Tax=Piloderma croceum (strain F 1598) TaxID=765440 RepID=A0A0C3F4L4_PILCF|nr:hypothetical protein PILCRDRAFT_823155 [Piloderma croceum F 1598]
MSVVRHQRSDTRRRGRVSTSMRTVTDWPISGPCLLILSVLALLPAYSLQASTLGERDLSLLSSGQISSLVSFPDPVRNVDPSNPNSHLSKILIPRVADTENNTIVREYIISTLKALNWHIEEDTVMDNTPVGMKRFTNVIATKDPTASRRVILSAHFDSKYFSSYPQNQFVGATDSAAPCAMILDLAGALNPLLESRKQRLDDGLEDDEDVSDTTLQLVFFDGEEAFNMWTDKDSVYGARHLAETWSKTYIAPNSKRRLLRPSGTTQIDTIEHLILLDLLGAVNPRIRSYFPDTAWLFDGLISIERRLAESGAFVYADEKDNWPSFFTPRTGSEHTFGYMGDDHVPFLHKGVNILHVIAEPFPRVWHTLSDDASALHIPTMRRWNLILRVFMSEYLNLRPDDGHRPQIARKSNGELGL